jgi:hypothetical protein
VKRHHLTAAGFLLPLAGGAAVWYFLLHENGGRDALFALQLVFLIGWPLLALLWWSGPSLLVALFTSPQQRAARRKRLKDAGYARSAPIRSWVRRAAFRADRYRCVYCHVKFRGGKGLEADHYRPYACGGRSDIFNLFALCKYHNDVKGYYWVSERTGAVSYKPYMVAPDLVMAAAIMRAEYWHARNPLRWLRAAWALAW